jgi:tetratricopeptide (TPR) repeat protein
VMLDLGQLQQAIDIAKDAVAVNDRIENPDLARDVNCVLALAYLRAEDAETLAKGRAAIEEACNYSSSRWSHPAFVLQGIIALRRTDTETALPSFQVAITEAEDLLEDGDMSYLALDAMGLALTGSAVCGQHGRVTEAADAFRAARQLTKHDGVVSRLSRLLDDLAESDRDGVVEQVRTIAEGRESEPPPAAGVA